MSEKTVIGLTLGTGVYLLLIAASVIFGWWWFAIPAIAFLLFVVIFWVIAYTSAPYNTWFTLVKEGTIKTVVAGENFVRFMPNINNCYFDESTNKIEEGTTARGESWFTRLTGRSYVSLFYPTRHILTFDIPAVKLKEDRNRIEKMEDKVVRYTKTVDHLIWKIDRPFVLKNVDLADGTRIDILGTGIYTVWDPYKILFELRADFFNNLDALVSGYIINKLKMVDINQLRGTAPEAQIKPEELVGAYNVQDVIGLKPKSLVVEEWSISPEDEEVQKAIQKQRIAREEGEAKRIAAMAERDKRRLEKEGDAQGDKAILEVYTNANMAPHVARIFANREIKELKGQFVEGGAGIIPTVPIQQQSGGQK